MVKPKILYFSLLSFAILSAFSSCSSSESGAPNAQQQQARPFPVVEVSARDIESYDEYPTEITGKNDNQLRPKISGYITKVLVDEGDKVSKGQVLFRLETNILSQNASAAEASVEAAKSNVTSAQVEVDKLIPLVEKNIISNVQLETAKARLMQAKAQLLQAEASYKSLVENIDFAVVRSPINGIVGRINYREGSLVSPQDPKPLTIVSDINTLYAYYTLNEKQYISLFKNIKGNSINDKLKGLPKVNLRLADGSIYDEKGTITSSSGQIDKNTGTIELRVDFKNNGLLSSGNTGVILVPKTYKNALVIPESSTYEQQGKVYAYKVFDNDSIYADIVTPLDRVNNLILIDKGLNKGDKILAKGILNAQNGMKITPQVLPLDSIIDFKTIF